MKVLPPNSWQQPDDHLDVLLSHPWYRHLAHILNEVCFGTHLFFRSQGCIFVPLPVTTGSVSSPIGRGSDSTPVKVNIQGYDIYLSDSMQFLLELMVRVLKSPCYYVMLSFRGEQVDERHLNEFLHAEVEILGELDDVFILAEDYVRFLAEHLLRTCSHHISLLAGDCLHLKQLVERQDAFRRVRFSDALTLLGARAQATRMIDGIPVLTRVGEQALLRELGDFLWITNMPHMAVPFYQAQEKGTAYSLTGDLLAGTGEILGAGQRAHQGDEVLENLYQHGVSAGDYEWYIKLKQTAPCQTSGFGLGIERLLLWLTKSNDIRNCALVVRDHNARSFP